MDKKLPIEDGVNAVGDLLHDMYECLKRTKYLLDNFSKTREMTIVLTKLDEACLWGSKLMDNLQREENQKEEE